MGNGEALLQVMSSVDFQNLLELEPVHLMKVV